MKSLLVVILFLGIQVSAQAMLCQDVLTEVSYGLTEQSGSLVLRAQDDAIAIRSFPENRLQRIYQTPRSEIVTQVSLVQNGEGLLAVTETLQVYLFDRNTAEARLLLESRNGQSLNLASLNSEKTKALIMKEYAENDWRPQLIDLKTGKISGFHWAIGTNQKASLSSDGKIMTMMTHEGLGTWSTETGLPLNDKD